MLVQGLINKAQIKEKYSEYSLEQAEKAVNKRSELYREHFVELKKKRNNFSVLHNVRVYELSAVLRINGFNLWINSESIHEPLKLFS